jgi:hypothetical protein
MNTCPSASMGQSEGRGLAGEVQELGGRKTEEGTE